MLIGLDSTIFPIHTPRKLAWILGLDKEHLLMMAKSAGRHYRPYDKIIRKEGGSIKYRHIDEPVGKLKVVQKLINKKILRRGSLGLPIEMTGGIKNKSVSDNASPHTSKEMVFAIDIRDFYPSTREIVVLKVWQKQFGCGKDVSALLTQLTTFQKRLPQGAPTSTLLGNFCLIPLIAEIKEIATQKQLGLSVYIDDITLSGNKQDVFDSVGSVIEVIQSHGYAISSRKSKKKLMASNGKQIVTGRIVNRKVEIEKEKVQGIRADIVQSYRLGEISNRKKASIYGKIVNIATVSKDVAEKLKEFADSMLLDIDETWESKEKEEFVPCLNTHHHIRQRVRWFREIARDNSVNSINFY